MADSPSPPEDAQRQSTERLLLENQELTRKIALVEQRLALQLEASTRANRRLKAEHDVARILSESLSLQVAAPSILESVCENLDFAVGVLWIVDHKACVLKCRDFYQVPTLSIDEFADATREQTVSIGVGLPGRVWAGQTPQALENAAQDPALPRRAAAAAADLHNAVAFPVLHASGFLGVMEFYGHDVGEPDESTVEMMASIGSQISQFIERRIAEKEVQREQDERRVAGRIQQQLLPRKMPELEGYEISGRCRSALDVGGDCFDFVPTAIDGDDSLCILVADASGHSIGAALMATETRAYVRALAMTYTDPGRLLSRANQRICEDSEREGFITAIVLRIVRRTGEIVYANAGHWAGVILNPRGEIRDTLDSTALPLGIGDADDFSPTLRRRLEHGETLLLFSDGAVDAFAPDDEPFGFQRLHDVVSRHIRDSADAIVDATYREILEFCGGRSKLDDDVTVVVVKRLNDSA